MHDTKGEWFKDDITIVQPGELPEADLYVGGFPCQSFSVAGKRGGFNDTRGTLFFEFMRLARKRQPEYLLLENVKGLLSHDRGKTFGTILNTLWECGYNAEWQVINSKNFGVPQSRNRVFIIGYLRGKSRPKIFPIRGKTTGNVRTIKKLGAFQGRIEKDNGIAGTLTKNYGMFSGDGTKVLTENKIRMFTPLECFRLQGFPDKWYYKLRKAGISDAQMYKAAGDSVTINVVEEIGRKLIDRGDLI